MKIEIQNEKTKRRGGAQYRTGSFRSVVADEQICSFITRVNLANNAELRAARMYSIPLSPFGTQRATPRSMALVLSFVLKNAEVSTVTPLVRLRRLSKWTAKPRSGMTREASGAWRLAALRWTYLRLVRRRVRKAFWDGSFWR